MEITAFILFTFLILYAGFIIALSFGYSKIKNFKKTDPPPTTKYSIVVPFRNESANLSRLLKSIAVLNYPTEKFEIIFVDDFSTDDSTTIINRWRMANGLIHTTMIENLLLTGSPKKDAISRVMPIAVNEWIVTTDADCVLPPDFLQSLNSYILTNNVQMIAGPVVYEGTDSLLHHFQRMDMLSLQGATIGAFGLGNAFMCNGANFAYTKQLFATLGGFTNNDKIASGDDVFLLQKAVAQVPHQVGFHKSIDGIVKTKPVDSWSALFNQRVRWASKAKAYNNDFAEDLAWVVFMGNFALVVGICLLAAAKLEWMLFGLLAALKLIPDVILLFQTNRFINKGAFFLPLISAFIYPFFVVAVALYSLFGKYEWKGRKFRM